MDEFRKSFKQNDKHKLDFIAQMYKKVKEEYGDNTKLFDIIDKYAEESNISYVTKNRVLSNILLKEGDKDEEYLINKINSQLYIEKEKIDTINNLSEESNNSLFVKEFLQIEEQEKNSLTKGATFINGYYIIPSRGEEALNSPMVTETIDLSEDKDDENYFIYDKELEDNPTIYCINCGSDNVLTISSSEAYCNKCNKRFLLSNV